MREGRGKRAHGEDHQEDPARAPVFRDHLDQCEEHGRDREKGCDRPDAPAQYREREEGDHRDRSNLANECSVHGSPSRWEFHSLYVTAWAIRCIGERLLQNGHGIRSRPKKARHQVVPGSVQLGFCISTLGPRCCGCAFTGAPSMSDSTFRGAVHLPADATSTGDALHI